MASYVPKLNGDSAPGDWLAQSLLLVRPETFRANEETQSSNVFQRIPSPTETNSILKKAQHEFDNFEKQLRENQIDVICATEKLGPETPDAVFPNNWFAHFPDGKTFLFPMEAANRRRERRPELLEPFSHGIIDL